MIFRYFYLDEMGLLSLHAQLNHRELVELSVSNEDVTWRKSGWSAALKAVFGVSVERTEEIKEAVSRKFGLPTENLLNEVQASLRTRVSRIRKKKTRASKSWRGWRFRRLTHLNNRLKRFSLSQVSRVA